MDIKYGRKRSGIIKELNSKLTEWHKSITDEEVADFVKRDAIVTGGSIASMLLGEQISDFDIYFKTKEAAIAVANYYLNEFIVNKTVELKTADDRVEVFIPSKGVVDLKKSEDPYKLLYVSPNALTLSDKVQIILRFHGDPGLIHTNFDFVHDMCWYDWYNNDLQLPAAALESLLSRTLIYKGSLYPICSILRAKEFITRGWRISAGELLKMAWQISELDLRDKEVVKEQLTGVDMLYMNMLIAALKDVSSGKINSTYMATIIDRVFNGEEPIGEE